MCHLNLDARSKDQSWLGGWEKAGRHRLFTLSQGVFSIELPSGFGIPSMSDEPFSLNSQVLNHNFKDRSFEVRHRVTIEYVRDRDLSAPLKPLYSSQVWGMVLLQGEDGDFGQPAAGERIGHASCLPGQAVNQRGPMMYSDGMGRKATGHWIIRPGREERHTPVNAQLRLPYDTTLHYAAMHLHPFAESLELRDLTTGATLVKVRAKPARKGIGLESVEHFSSDEGVPLYKDHEYELVSVYNNTSAVNQDAMAVMLLYLQDRRFKSPTPKQAAR
jgi:hypothetical protein